MPDPIATKLDAAGFQPAGGRYAGYTPQDYLRRTIAECEDWPADELALMQRAICGLDERDTWMPDVLQALELLGLRTDDADQPPDLVGAVERLLRLQAQNAEKQAHGCTDSFCPICDAKPPPCPRCGTTAQVWRNQRTGRLTCHRAGCHVEVPA